MRVATVDFDPQQTLTNWAKVRPASVSPIAHYVIKWNEIDALAEDDAIDPADVLIIDTPPGIEEQPRGFSLLLRTADLVIVPVRPTFDDAIELAWVQLNGFAELADGSSIWRGVWFKMTQANSINSETGGTPRSE